METNRYVEYSQQLANGGSVVVQIPEAAEFPIQIILNVGRQVIVSLDEYSQISEVVAEALEKAGRAIRGAIKEEGAD